MNAVKSGDMSSEERSAKTRLLPARLHAGCLLAGGLLVGSALLADEPGPNIVLVTLDTTRADHLGAWGWPHARTPNLDALAARGARFARCDTAAPITLPSHATILSGLLPPRHGVRDNGTFVLDAKVETVAERLRAGGYDTAAVVSAVVLARRHGLDQGFRAYDDDLWKGYAAGTEVSERQAEATTEAALAALGRLRPPFFLWVHYFDPHEEYRPPARFADAGAGPYRLYDAEITYMDAEIGRLLARLPADTAVVVVGDHGEMLGEHGETSHGLLLARGARRVPLLLAGPGVPAGRATDCLVRTADVAPTLLALAGAPVPAGLDGESLLPVPERSSAAACDRASYSESFLPFFAYRWYPLRAISDGRLLFLQAPKPSLFRLERDPEEARDLAASEPALARSWAKRLVSLLSTMGETVEARVEPENVLTAEQRRQLESLGYLGASLGGASLGGAAAGTGYAPAVVSADLPDPRRMTQLARDLHEAARQVQENRFQEALPRLSAIVKQDPHNFPALSLAGLCLKETGKLESALALLQQASRQNPLSAVPVANAAAVLLELGRQPEAEREYRRALALDPSQTAAASNLARLLRERGARQEALSVLDGSLAAGAHAPEIHLERGVALAEAGRMADALASFHEAARRNPTDPVALENAARAAYQLERYREAARLYEQLLRLAAHRLDAWKTLGAIYLYSLDDRPAALAAFRRALALETDAGEKTKLVEVIAALGG